MNKGHVPRAPISPAWMRQGTTRQSPSRSRRKRDRIRPPVSEDSSISSGSASALLEDIRVATEGYRIDSARATAALRPLREVVKQLREECAIKTRAIEQLIEDEAKVREMLQELEELGEKEADSVGIGSPQWLEGVSPCLTSHGGARSASTPSLPCTSPMSACLKVPPHGPSASPESSPSHLKAAREDLTKEITQLEDLRLCVQQICFALRSSVHDDPAGQDVSPEPPLLPRPALALKARSLMEASLRPALSEFVETFLRQPSEADVVAAMRSRLAELDFEMNEARVGEN